MPRGNVEMLRKAVEAFRRRDSGAVRELFDEQAEFRSAILGGIEGGIYRAHSDIERYFSDMDDAFDDWHTEEERYFDVGSDRVVLVCRIVGQGRGSGVPIDQLVGTVVTLRDKRVVRGEVYLDPHGALKAGLQNAFETFTRGDIATAAYNLDPDIQWEHYLGSGAPEEGVYRGREEVGRLLERLRDSWKDIRVDVREIVEADEDKYVVQAVMSAKGRTSEIELEAACEYVLEFRDSKAVRVGFALTGPVPRLSVANARDPQRTSQPDVMRS